SAEWRILSIGKAAEDRTADDLIHEAIVRTLSEDRSWRKSAVDFYGHLRSVIRSIASHWAEQYDPNIVPASSLAQEDDEGNEYNPAEAPPIQGYRQRDEVEDRDLVERIETAFHDDSLVTRLIECIKSGMTGPETQDALNISRTEYETGRKRMKRKARLLFS